MQTITSNPLLVEKYNNRKKLMLGLSIVFDLVGMITYLLPVFGETFDLIWAPIAGFALYIMYGGYLGVFGGMFVFMEELIPFTDFIPGFTIMWFMKYVVFGKKTLQHFVDSKGTQVLPQTTNPLPVNR